jgi:hypothetical protein
LKLIIQKTINEEETLMIKEHLALVFNKVTKDRNKPNYERIKKLLEGENNLPKYTPTCSEDTLLC